MQGASGAVYMIEIYLIRHTTPAVAKGICYGQTDLDIVETFSEEAAIIQQHLPEKIKSIHSSPLQRCSRLARHLFPAHTPVLHDDLMEIHCGEWEMKSWDELPKEVIDPWMKDFVHVRIPGGESYLDLHQRVTRCFNEIIATEPDNTPLAIVGHGGVIRSILSYLTDTPLIDSFKVFSLHYGCVIRLSGETTSLQHEILSNLAPPEKEQHKPRSFY
jgi:alpha-ribazole phosphatase